MTEENVNGKGKPKGKRGRPPLTKEEKAKRKADREKQKSLQKKLTERKKAASRVDTEDYLKETLEDIVDPNLEGISLVTKNLETTLQPLPFSSLEQIEESQPESSSGLLENMEGMTRDLEDRIKILENEMGINSKQLKQLNKISDQYLEERVLTKELIRIEQNLVIENEKLLQEFFSPEEGKVSASYDLPDIMKGLLQFFGWKKDEITLEAQIKASEVKISKRNQSLVAINGELADYLIVIRFHQDKFESLDQSLSNYRVIRLEVGRDARQLREFIQQKTVMSYQREFLGKFQESLGQINKIGQTFSSVMEKTKNSLVESHQAIKKLQREAVKTESGSLLDKLSTKIDSQINEFLKDIKIK